MLVLYHIILNAFNLLCEKEYDFFKQNIQLSSEYKHKKSLRY